MRVVLIFALCACVAASEKIPGSVRLLRNQSSFIAKKTIGQHASNESSLVATSVTAKVQKHSTNHTVADAHETNTSGLGVAKHRANHSSDSAKRGTLVVGVDTHGALRRVRHPEKPAHKKLSVAFAVFVSDIGSRAWADALRVLAHGTLKAAASSRHAVHLVALAPERLDSAKEKELLSFGFERVIKKPVPVQPSLIEGQMAREHMQRVQGQDERLKFLLADETIKYWGLALTEYDRVLVLDADTMILDPMDELMERQEDFIGVYDHGLDIDSSAMPPTQGGFLLFRPNEQDFAEVNKLTREGDWGGDGWKKSGIGYCYGGVGPDGLLTYFFNQGALPQLSAAKKGQLPEGIQAPKVPGSRMLAVDRAVYDVVINKRLTKELEDKDPVQTLANVKSAHFTGDCIKPWLCSESKDSLCEGLFQKWWELRAEVEAKAGLPPSSKSCVRGQYEPLAH